MSKKVKTAPEPTTEEIRKWVKSDIEKAVTLLNMIRNDPDLMDTLADRIVERVQLEAEKRKEETANG